MKAWAIEYEGSYLGGTAVVVATSREEAISLLKADPQTCGFTNVVVMGSFDLTKAQVLYNDNGDY